MNPGRYTKSLIALFQKNANAANAVQMERYMRNQFEFFGIKAPLMRELTKQHHGQFDPPPYEQLEKIIFELFAQPQRELHHTAIDICGKSKKDWPEDSIDLFERMVLLKSWWDSVDSINSVCLRPYFRRFPERRFEKTLDWIESGNIWLQRVSLIFQLRYKEGTDTKLLTRNINLLRDSDEFFVQKAIGWILRDYGHTHPDWVKGFVSKTVLKPLSRREALKKLG
jgi:3-methyladenine DNA glycosylase AlkD